LGAYKQRIMENGLSKTITKWAILQTNYLVFFEKFSPAIVGHFGEGLLELKNRAMENVSYIETEFSTIPSNINTSDLLGFNTQLRLLANNRNEKRSKHFLIRFTVRCSKRCGSRCRRFQHELCKNYTMIWKLIMNASPCAIKILCCALWNQSIYLKI
jgi:hypothetical protein